MKKIVREFVKMISFVIREKTKYSSRIRENWENCSWIREFLHIRDFWFVNGQITLKTRNFSIVREFVKTKNMVREVVNRTPLPWGASSWCPRDRSCQWWRGEIGVEVARPERPSPLLARTFAVGKELSSFGLWLKFRPAKNFESFVFYCYYYRLTKISTD